MIPLIRFLADSIGLVIADLMPFHTDDAVLFIELHALLRAFFTALTGVMMAVFTPFQMDLAMLLMPLKTDDVTDLIPFQAFVTTVFIAFTTVVIAVFIPFQILFTMVLIAVTIVLITV